MNLPCEYYFREAQKCFGKHRLSADVSFYSISVIFPECDFDQFSDEAEGAHAGALGGGGNERRHGVARLDDGGCERVGHTGIRSGSRRI
jgi:hypothetical protein